MLARESVKARLAGEHGISYTEFSYMLLQAHDYLHLHRKLGIELQIGGSDQWGNILSGVDLIRRKRQRVVHALAWPLLTAPGGTKIGKTAGARLWLDPAKTSPYQFQQHWMQLDDREVDEQLKFFSLRPLTEIEELLAAHREAPERRIAQRALADDVTTIVHGALAARAASEAAEVLFGGDPVDASAAALDTIAGEVPTSRVPAEDLNDVIDLLVGTGLATSRSDARRLVQQGSVRANDQVVTAEWSGDGVELLHGRYLLLRKGKRTFHLVEVLKAPG